MARGIKSRTPGVCLQRKRERERVCRERDRESL